MTNQLPDLSFEFFPPRSPVGLDKLVEVNQSLAAFDPNFVSVTYGALGSTQDGTLDALKKLQQSGAKVAPHLTGVGGNKEQIRTVVDQYCDLGVDRLVALRGDLPEAQTERGEFAYAEQLVRFIRETYGDRFHIEVAAYPEFHPESDNPKTELSYFKRKLDAGANSAITQYFYNADSYFAFVDEAQRMGINAPIVPGILPIHGYEQIMRFSKSCGAEVPRWIQSRLEYYQHDEASFKSFAFDVVFNLCLDLIDNEVPGFHFYSLNKAELVSPICQALGYAEGSVSLAEGSLYKTS